MGVHTRPDSPYFWLLLEWPNLRQLTRYPHQTDDAKRRAVEQILHMTHGSEDAA
jgi:hypothetical protein